MSGWVRLGLGGVVLAAVAVAGAVGLRHLEFFRLRQVEIVGLRFLAPEQVLRDANLGSDRNVFDSVRDVRRRVVGVPGIMRATVERRLPGTLRITVEEQVPVAFVSGQRGMVVLDPRARPLPYDPTVRELDLPVVARVDTILTRTLASVRQVDPWLFDQVDLASRHGDLVTLAWGDRSILFRGVPNQVTIRAVEAVRRYLGAQGEDYSQLDAQNTGMVVVRRAA